MNETPEEYWARFEDEHKRRQRIDRPWSEYPVGTQCFAITGGRWTKTVTGWKWGSNGGTFPTPGGDHNGWVLLPK
jgi:hypothetical protein